MPGPITGAIPAVVRARADAEAELEQIGAAVGHLIKAGAKPESVYALSGRLVYSKSGWGLLEVPNALVRGLFQAVDLPGVELPPSGEDGQLNAHISVFRKEDVEKIGGPDKISEWGRRFRYQIGPIQEVEPKGWGEMSRVWFVRCTSPELKALRASYGLTPLPNGDHEFHITVCVRKRGALRNNDVSKAADAALFHGSPGRFDRLEPRPSRVLGGAEAVFATPNRTAALTFAAPWRDEDFEQGTVDGQLYMREKRPGAYREHFGGRRGYLYGLSDDGFRTDDRLTRLERIRDTAVEPLAVEDVPDVLEALESSRDLLMARHDERLPWEEPSKAAASDEVPLELLIDGRHRAAKLLDSGATEGRFVRATPGDLEAARMDKSAFLKKLTDYLISQWQGAADAAQAPKPAVAARPATPPKPARPATPARPSWSPTIGMTVPGTQMRMSYTFGKGGSIDKQATRLSWLRKLWDAPAVRQTFGGAAAGATIGAGEIYSGIADPDMSPEGQLGLIGLNALGGASIGNPALRRAIFTKTNPAGGRSVRPARVIGMGAVASALPKYVNLSDSTAQFARTLRDTIRDNPENIEPVYDPKGFLTRLVDRQVDRITDKAQSILHDPKTREFVDGTVNKATTTAHDLVDKATTNLKATANEAARTFATESGFRPALGEGARMFGLNAAGSLGGSLIGRLAAGSLGEALVPDDERAGYATRRRKERYRDLINMVGSLGGGVAGLYAATKYGPRFFPKQSRALDFGPLVALDKGYRSRRKRKDESDAMSWARFTHDGPRPGDVKNVMQLAERIARRRKTGA